MAFISLLFATHALSQAGLWAYLQLGMAMLLALAAVLLPFLFEFAKQHFRTRQFAEASLDPHKLTWIDGAGHTHKVRSIHTIKTIDIDSDLFSNLTWITFDDHTTWAWRFEDKAQAKWWADLLRAWVVTYQRADDEQSRRARAALHPIRTEPHQR